MIRSILSSAVLLGSILCLSSCSDFESTTDLGKDVIDSVDPSLVDINGSFKPFNPDSNFVDASFSVPGTLPNDFGVHVEDVITVGSFNQDTSVGNVLFELKYPVIKAKDSIDTVISVEFSFSRVVSFTLADSLSRLVTIKRSSSSNGQAAPNPTNAIGSFTVSPKDTSYIIVDTSKSFLNSMTKFITTPDSLRDNSDTLLQVAINLSGNFNGLVRFGYSPKMILKIKTKSANNVIDTTVVTINTKSSNYVVSAPQEVLNIRSLVPVSNFQEERVAIFRFDARPLWAQMNENNFSNIVKATFITDPGITTPEIASDSSYKVNWTLTNEIKTSSDGLDSLFSLKNSDLWKDVFNADTNKNLRVLAVERQLQTYYSSKPDYLYLNLRVVNTKKFWGSVTWSKPVFEAILSKTE